MPLCDMWQQQNEPRRAVASGRAAGHNPIRVASCRRLLGQTNVGPRLTGLGRNVLGCKPLRLDRWSGLGLVQLNHSFWAGLRFGPL